MEGPPPTRVRVAIVDDVADMRQLLRLQFEFDERFEVVGEGIDGHEAITVVAETRPDLLILDRNMPRLGGVEAIPAIRERSPQTAIVLYTASADAGIHQAALAAGALEVLEKASGGGDFVEQLVTVLLDGSARSDATVEVQVGPVSAEAARVWVTNTTLILDAVVVHPEVLDEPLPDDVVDLFRTFLRQWAQLSTEGEQFHWAVRARPEDVTRVVQCWGAIDRMTDDDLATLGVHWSPPQGEPFFRALTAGVLAALERHDETRRLARLLGAQWAAYQSKP